VGADGASEDGGRRYVARSEQAARRRARRARPWSTGHRTVCCDSL